jgi:hypothetical protein
MAVSFHVSMVPSRMSASTVRLSNSEPCPTSSGICERWWRRGSSAIVVMVQKPGVRIIAAFVLKLSRVNLAGGAYVVGHADGDHREWNAWHVAQKLRLALGERASSDAKVDVVCIT